MKPLPKNYDPKEAEPRWQKAWEEQGVHAWKDDRPRDKTFVIDTPPPTVSGVLHMGHIFSYTQADFVARYQRMSGKDVFYPMGFDDNGLPTERLVEKIKNKRASQYPTREDFIQDCRAVVQSAEEEFRALFKSVALSVDWNREYQTISADVRKLSQQSFLDLLGKNEAYRDFRPTYWDWVDQTAIAQAEIENKEMPGTMNDIHFALGDGKITIATTRPELLGACVAVMYHPEDPNAADYKDQYAITPLFGVKVPMIADTAVERDKGTGLVMCCTFGDDTDKEWWRKYQLPMRPLLGIDGKITFTATPEGIEFIAGRDGGNAASALSISNCADIITATAVFDLLRGLKPKQANAKMIEMLTAEGTLAKQTNISHTVKCAERSGTPIEIIPTSQWFVKITDKKEALKSRGAECVWHPEFMRLRLDQWIDGLKEDWCVSRQRFFGVPFPVWYVFDNPDLPLEQQNARVVFPASEDLPVDPIIDLPKGYNAQQALPFEPSTGAPRKPEKHPTRFCTDAQGKRVLVIPDFDVMDTWATSSISPQISAKSLVPNKLFPADIRPQAHEIIRTWAFYTIVKAHLHANTIPWKDLMISGWCLAADKTKMSKSKGNVITPVELIRDKGADAVRYWASTSRLGADTAFSEDLLKIGKKLVTKLWNATSFAAIHLGKLSGKPGTAAEDMQSGKVSEALDKWILSRLAKTVEKATREFERFEYCDARVAVEEFFWKDFCDNYLELVKARAYGEGASDQLPAASGQTTDNGQLATSSAHFTLYHCLNTILRLFAPFIPHVTDELYSHLFDEQHSVHSRGTWPKAEDYAVDDVAEVSGVAAVSVLEAIRKAKSEKKVSIRFPIRELTLAPGSAKGEWVSLEPLIADLKSAGAVENVLWTQKGEGSETEDKKFTLAITFGEQADVA